ncbi:Cytochrome P450 89A2 [Apostasia shenzhenica]|uniref:Cytochrome P450 89A2 n=1 Tax=Apostasia shenzhenica TaxID=1088818 RepID=A0A2I0AUI2_9ASPA|nr:Cytochrome P450 89A2 [Apostasia shenzhenica]
MEAVVLILLSLVVPAALYLLLSPSKRSKKLPPGPPAVPFLGNLLWLRNSVSHLNHSLLKDLHAKYGPIITLRVGSRLSIFIADRFLAHKALIELGASFSDRPTLPAANHLLTSDQHNISSGRYGPLWRLFRRNLATEILHPAKIRVFSPAREWVLAVLLRDLESRSAESGDGTVVAMESFQFAMFSLLVFMCFGEKLDEKEIRDIEDAHRSYLQHFHELKVFSFVPSISKYVFRRRWTTILQLKRRQRDLFVPLIRARRAQKENRQQNDKRERFVHSYVDSLIDIKLAEEGGRGLTEDEIVTLCSEFFTAGTDTTATALQWTMAELVKHQEVQQKLLQEIEEAVGIRNGEGIKEEDLQKMQYLKAVIMESLRRHPPAQVVIPHTVTGDIEFEGYTIPKEATVNFVVTEMNWDEKVWEAPKEFRPERFMSGGEGEGVDVTGTREIKMMPFGAGRRICPGYGLAMLHLEYFVANLLREFNWETAEGEEVDFSEKHEFTLVMKNPLRARLSPRRPIKTT